MLTNRQIFSFYSGHSIPADVSRNCSIQPLQQMQYALQQRTINNGMHCFRVIKSARSQISHIFRLRREALDIDVGTWFFITSAFGLYTQRISLGIVHARLFRSSILNACTYNRARKIVEQIHQFRHSCIKRMLLRNPSNLRKFCL